MSVTQCRPKEADLEKMNTAESDLLEDVCFHLLIPSLPPFRSSSFLSKTLGIKQTERDDHTGTQNPATF